MAKGTNQKQKLLYLAEIFKRETDENHGLSAKEISARLAVYDISEDRKTLYNDIEILNNFGMEIIHETIGHNHYYKLINREFQLAELKLLVDSVQSSKYITEKKSRELIRKLGTLTSRHEAAQLNRQVEIAGRVKTMNESIFINIDAIHNAINNNFIIEFKYFNWDKNKKQVPIHNGKVYSISPWTLIQDQEYYYLIGYEAESDKIKHFRVDKMIRITTTNNPRQGKECFEAENPTGYSTRLFGMYGGTVENVTLIAENRLAGVIIDRFGKNVNLFTEDDEHFKVNLDVVPSNHFLGWVMSIGSGIKIAAPEDVVEAMREEVRRLSKEYLSE